MLHSPPYQAWRQTAGQWQVTVPIHKLWPLSPLMCMYVCEHVHVCRLQDNFYHPQECQSCPLKQSHSVAWSSLIYRLVASKYSSQLAPACTPPCLALCGSWRWHSGPCACEAPYWLSRLTSPRSFHCTRFKAGHYRMMFQRVWASGSGRLDLSCAACSGPHFLLPRCVWGII